ncbi:MAG: hypothetical protein RLZZ488_2756 [Pseudomonadota bacterium]
MPTVVVPEGVEDELGLDDSTLDAIYSTDNLNAVRSMYKGGEPFEVNLLLREDWKNSLPVKRRSGDVRTMADSAVVNDVVAIGDLSVDEFGFDPATLAMFKKMPNRHDDAPASVFDVARIKIKADDATAVALAINRLHKLPGVMLAEPNVRYKHVAAPSDPLLPSLWGLKKINVTGLWPQFNSAGKIVIAVLDTGVDSTHEDLRDNIWRNPGEVQGNGIDDDNNGFVDDIQGWDFVNNDADPADSHGHGTHCAGTIAARGNNGLGVVGVNWTASVMPVRVIANSGFTNDFDIFRGTAYAIANGAMVLSNSYGGIAGSVLMSEAVKASQNAGRLFVAAAGNDSEPKALYPAYYTKTFTNVLSVAATTDYDVLSYFSNRGDGVDVAAPGSNIVSTMPGNRYMSLNGTSMATPHVAGVAALLWNAVPQRTVSQLRSAIFAGSDSFAALSGLVAAGGRINALKSMNEMKSAQPQPPAVKIYDNGLVWQYFEGVWQSLPDLSTLNPKKSGTAVTFKTSVADRKDDFALNYQGYVRVPKSGRYKFFVKSDNEARLMINNTTVVTASKNKVKSADVDLSEGYQKISLEYLHKAGKANLKVHWQASGKKKRELKGGTVLYH